jgi:hypothetical protein
MFDLSRALNFALNEDNLGSFDELLDCRRIEDIEYKNSQRNKLLEQQRLLEKMQKLYENLNFSLKESESVGLSNEYKTYLDENLNPELKSKCKNLYG